MYYGVLLLCDEAGLLLSLWCDDDRGSVFQLWRRSKTFGGLLIVDKTVSTEPGRVYKMPSNLMGSNSSNGTRDVLRTDWTDRKSSLFLLLRVPPFLGLVSVDFLALVLEPICYYLGLRLSVAPIEIYLSLRLTLGSLFSQDEKESIRSVRNMS